ncbi:MAG: glycosyltransferase family 4 protein [Salinibacter sp.]|uniref:glycosyltransferase family 4 protein n=1 Tax=Salinibacter sp. TaxID=2065818 RepID=UPI0035D4B8B7
MNSVGGSENGLHVAILVPNAHDLQTGGNVYNRQMTEALGPEGTPRVVSWEPENDSIPDAVSSAADGIVVDSLLARHPGALRALQEARPAATIILLIHYLRCIDPATSDPEVAAAERGALDAVDGAVTTSRFTKQSLVEEGMPADRVKVAPPGLGERYRGPRPSRLGRAAPRMLTVANLLPEKGLQAFVEVLRDLRFVPWTWTLVGDASLDPDYAEGVIRRVREAGLSERVTYTGSVPPGVLRSWYDRADLFVLPSRFETRSLSTREAMARGLPVVGYRVGGLAENFGMASAGHLVPAGNRAAFRSALRSILTDPMARTHKGRTAWRHSQTFPTWAEAAERFQFALNVLCSRG